MRRFGRLEGLVTAVPANAVASADIAGGIEAQKITGVRYRRHVAEGQDWMTLAEAAARRVLDTLNTPLDSLDALVVVTQTPTSAVPASGYSLHHRLGLPTYVPVIEVNWSCAGYVYGLRLSMGLLRQGYSRVLLVVGDTTSRILDRDDRATAPVFGDAVSATVVVHDNIDQLFNFGTDGAGAELLCQKPGGHLTMTGSEVFNFTLARVPEMVKTVLLDFDIAGQGEPDFLLFHQANEFMLKHLVKKCGLLPRFDGRIPCNIGDFGNCSSASIPLLMSQHPQLRAALLAGPTKLGLLGFGAGFAWCAAAMYCPPVGSCEMVEV